MIHINKNLSDKPKSLTDVACMNSLNQVMRDGNGNNIIENIYKGKNNLVYDSHLKKNIGDVQKALKDLYHNKCAYCEKKTYIPDIEHYRPKQRVDIPDTKNPDSNTKLKDHKGYFWLAYEWSNLIPSCESCNRLGGKKNQFPIINENNRIYVPTTLNGLPYSADLLSMNRVERPYLLHPEIDQPQYFFKFDIKGRIEGIDNENRGEITIKICNLRHPDLNFWREKVILEFSKDFEDCWNLYSHDDNNLQLWNNRILTKLYNYIHNPDAEYLLLVWYIYKNFKTIFAPPILPSGVCPKLHEIYDEFYKNNPI